MAEDIDVAIVLTLLPLLLGFLAYHYQMRSDDGRWRKRKYFALGSAIGLVWGLSSLLKEYVELWYRFDELSVSAASEAFLFITLFVVLFAAIFGGIGYAIGIVMDRTKGPKV
ncbi:MAG: hypothetical protein RSE16_11020 [Sphingobium sp.]|nr:MAG: hypothetical protein RSE16_11020 [Sphingobium sp.]